MKLKSDTISMVVALFIFGWITANAQGIKFEKSTFSEALTKAAQENKLLFFDCYTTWCGPCKKMSAEVFPLEEVGRYFNENFVSLKMDMEKGEGVALAEQYNITAYPTMLFINAQAEIVHKIVAFQNGAELIEQAKIALDPSRQIRSLEKRYADGEREISFMAQYIKALGVENNRERIREVGTAFIATMQPDQFATEEGYTIIAYTGLKYKSDPFFYFLNNKDKFLAIESMPKEYYTYIIEGAINDYINEIASTGTFGELKEAIEGCKKDYAGENQEFYENSWTGNYHIANKEFEKWWELQIAAAENLKRSDKKQGTYSIIQAAYELGQREHFADADKNLLYKAVEAVEQIKSENSENLPAYYCLTYLYKRIGNKEKAMKNIGDYIMKKGAKGEEDKRVAALKAEIESM